MLHRKKCWYNREQLGGDEIGSAGGSTIDSSASSRGGSRATAREGYGSALELMPKADAARTSTKFVSQEDKEGGASWEEEFFFSRVAGETAVRIICVDKVCFHVPRLDAFCRSAECHVLFIRVLRGVSAICLLLLSPSSWLLSSFIILYEREILPSRNNLFGQGTTEFMLIKLSVVLR